MTNPAPAPREGEPQGPAGTWPAKYPTEMTPNRSHAQPPLDP